MGLYSFLDKKRTLWIVLGLLVALVVISILTANVYRRIGLKGTVYVWNDAPAGAVSQAYTFDKDSKEAQAWAPPAGMDVSPLSGVYIKYRAVYRNNEEENVLAITSRDGTYSRQSSRWKITGAVPLYITASKDGYRSANGTATNKEGFFYSGGPSVAYFILVPEQ